MWAGILSVPPLISWYLDHLPSIHAQMPAWAGFASLSVGVGLAIMALVANAVANANLDRLLRDSGRRPLEAPPQSIATTPETELDHSLIDISPFELLAFFDQHLSPQALKLLEPYRGKRLRLTATLFDVHVYEDGRLYVYGTIPSPSDPKWIGVHVNFYLDKNWENRLLVLKRDKPITAIGEIWKVDSKTIFLNHCELVGDA
jgi:hypothetical protein